MQTSLSSSISSLCDDFQPNVMGDDKQDIEADANDFAYYLSNRYPIRLPMLRTSRRLGAFKRKYDKVEIPKVWKERKNGL